jgi:DNA (cytosine-5)-methyltransferase 1
MGYHMAGFEVTGVDLEPQPRYPFEFHQASALDVDLDGYDAYVASPPCQGYSKTRHMPNSKGSPLLIDDIRQRLEATGKPYIIENVEAARWAMKDPVRLCGSSFGLRVQRHRLFEANFELEVPPCDHAWQNRHKPYKIYRNKKRVDGLGYLHSGIQPVYGNNQNVGGNSVFLKSVAMGIDWMDEHGLNQSLPPVYTKYLGEQLAREVKR